MEIIVVGRHEYVVTPETGLMTMTVEVEADTQREAATTASGLVAEVAADLDVLAAPGGPVSWRSVDSLRTSVWRRYGGSDEPRRHAASARIQARFTDVPALASFLAEWGVREGCHLQGVTWELSEATRARLDEDALAKAVQDARRRAVVIARVAGAGDVQAVSFRDPSASLDQQPGRPQSVMLAGGASPIPVVADDIVGTVAIEARYTA